MKKRKTICSMCGHSEMSAAITYKGENFWHCPKCQWTEERKRVRGSTE